tara:strand:+ start:631 stop:1302 length:672 start_codon:yes stop_codon:yes gene_type:complete
MAVELRLLEDTPRAGTEAVLAPGLPRAIYVASGQVTINGRLVPADEGIVAVDGLTIAVGDEGATLWRFEVVQTEVAAEPLGGRGHRKLAHVIRPERIGEALLLRLDSVAFPAGGCALLHTHQGPGIRCLKEGAIRIDTEGQSSSYAPGGAWFEAGPEPVFAQADGQIASRFIRAMVLPRTLLGTSSIRYVNEEDKAKPKSQSYRVFDEAAMEIPESQGGPDAG